jgi:hypothetical protein
LDQGGCGNVGAVSELFDVRVRLREGVLFLDVSGDVGPFALSRIRAAVTDVLVVPGPTGVMLDVSRVTFIDHHGLAELEHVRRRVEAGGLTFTMVTGSVVEAAGAPGTTDRRKLTQPTDAIQLSCRVCSKRLELQPARVEIVDGRVVYRCQYCEHTFLMRAEDAEALAGPSD